MKLAIVGTRMPTVSYEQFKELLSEVVDLSKFDTIVSGGAKGIDSYAQAISVELNKHLIEYIPNYQKFGRLAPLNRNTDIVNASDVVVAFPSKYSKGTYDSIRKAEKSGKRVVIINI